MTLRRNPFAPYAPMARLLPCAMLLALPHGAFAQPVPASVPDEAPAASPASPSLNAPLSVSWKFTGQYFGNNPSSPTVQNGVVFFATGTRLYAVDAVTGAQKWRYPADQGSQLPTTVQTNLVVNGDLVYVGGGDGLYAFGATDGQLKWHYSIPSGVATAPAATESAVYVTGQNGRLYAISSKTGESLGGSWNAGGHAGIEVGDIVSDPSIANNIMFLVTSNQILRAVDLATGVQKYSYRLDGETSVATPAISGESMYIVMGNVLASYRLSTGQRRWFLRLYDTAAAPPALDAAGNAYIVTSDRYVYAVNDQGKSLWRQSVRVPEQPLARPIVAGSTLYVTSAFGGITAINTATGAITWNYNVQPSSTSASTVPTSTNISAAPLVALGTLFVLSDDGALTAFRKDASDSLAPMATDFYPVQGDALNGRAPFHFGAKVYDEGSGLNLSTLHFQVDGKEIARRIDSSEAPDKASFVFEAATGLITYDTVEGEGRTSELKNGHHTAAIMIQDWNGNALNKSWSFTTDDTLPQRQRPNRATTNGGAPGSNGSYTPQPGTSGPGQNSGGGGRGGRRGRRGGAPAD